MNIEQSEDLKETMMHSKYAAKCTFTLKLVCHDPTMAFLAELMQQDTYLLASYTQTLPYLLISCDLQ